MQAQHRSSSIGLASVRLSTRAASCCFVVFGRFGSVDGGGGSFNLGASASVGWVSKQTNGGNSSVDSDVVVEDSTAISAGATSAVSSVAGAAATSNTAAVTAAAAATDEGFSGERMRCFLVLVFAGVDGDAFVLVVILPSRVSL